MCTVTQMCHGNFKINVYLTDDDIDQCFHFASMISCAADAVLDPHKWNATPLIMSLFNLTINYDL